MVGCSAYRHRLERDRWLVYWIAEPDMIIASFVSEGDAIDLAVVLNKHVLEAQERKINGR